MPPNDRQQGGDGAERLIAEARRHRQLREQTYREQALKILPWICGRCGREFAGKKLRELTVHHKDHNHDNNPPDGSNWELLCMYCHDNEHSRSLVAEAYGEAKPGGGQEPLSTHTPFADLAALLKKKK
jgi:5-methylcytosine-specific restriction endonuclease McrA